jgi:hypothetical protein
MAEIELTTTAAANYSYTITYELLRGATPISTLTVEKEDDNTAASRALSEIPSMTWVDTPGAGTFTYSIEITVTGSGISTADAVTRALNAIIFG